MNDFLKLDQAAARVARLTADRILQDGADGRIPIYWRNSAQVPTHLFDFTKKIPGTDSFRKWMQLHPFDVAQFETTEQSEVMTFELTDQDVATLENLNISAVIDGWMQVIRIAEGDKGATVRRDQLHVDVKDLLRVYGATLAPVKEVAEAPAGTTAPAIGTPAVEVLAPGTTTASEPAPGTMKPAKRRAKKLSIESAVLDYLVSEYKASQGTSAAKFHKHLCETAGATGSPFEMGTGKNARKLFCPAARSYFDAGTLGNLMPKIRPQ